MIKIINLVGIDDNNRIIVEHNKGILSQLSFRIEGNSGFLYKLDKKEFDISMLILGGEKFTLQLTFSKNTLLFNSIGMAEGNRKSLHQLSEILSQISNPVVNHPENVLLTVRDSLGDILAGIKDVKIPRCLKMMPKSIRDVEEFVRDSRFTFPFLFRPVVTHGPQSLIKINSLGDMEKLHRFAFDGQNTFYVTQFLDFKSEDGLYRKMRFIIIGDQVIPRHLILSASWQIHTEDKEMENKFRKQQTEEEIDFLGKIDLSIGKRLMKIKSILGLDYFGVDCAIGQSGEILIFEINPFSMLGVGKEDIYHQSIIRYTIDSLGRLIKLKASESEI